MTTTTTTTEEKRLEIQEILEKQLVDQVDLSITAYLSTMIEEGIKEKQINQISDIYNILNESLFTYQICKDETEGYNLCQNIFQDLIHFKWLKDPDLVKKDIMKNIHIGDIILGKYSEDGQWYVAKVDQMTDTEIQVTYTDYGNTEWLDPFSIQFIDKAKNTDDDDNNNNDNNNNNNNNNDNNDDPTVQASSEDNNNNNNNDDDDDDPSSTHNKSSLVSEGIRSKQGIKLSDATRLGDDVSQKINSLMYQTNRFLTDTTRGQKELSTFGLTSQQKRKLKEEMKEKEKVLKFDPMRYLKSIRQKARPEWFDVTKRKGSKSVRIPDLVMYTLDEKELLLNGADFNLEYGRKYGLIGLNGCGKTTLLRRISRYDLKQFPAHLRVLHVEQEILGDEQTVLDYVLSCDVVRNELVEQEKELLKQKNELHEAKNELNEGKNELNEAKNDKHDILDKKLQQLYEKMRELDVLDVEHKAKKVLEGLGFRQEMLQWPTNRLSGGWRMRAALAGALFVHPDVLLLDEPTNHLDFPSVIWLENYLRDEFTNTLLIVSHDREFLNSVVDRIIHMEKQNLREYPGNFKHFLQTRQMEYETALKNYENQQEEIQHHKRFIDRFRASAARAASVQSRIKMLNAMERFKKPEKPFSLQFDFPQCSHVQGDIISLRNVTFGYNSKEILLNGISRSVDCESRIGVIGANGAGKSTLIYLMLEQLKPIKGDVIRNRKARIVLFTQHHIDQLDLSMSPMDFLLSKFADDCRKEKRQAEYVRGKLGAFGLTGEIVNQRMVFLSGGQKSRVAFTVLTWENPHFIIMDEPTNHLDMETIDALIDAIHRWNGGILVVSHDQHFLMNIAKKFWSLSIKSATIEEFNDLNKAKEFAAARRT